MVASSPIINGFPFFNEVDVLEFRLTVLHPVVDKFILVEGTRTHTGLPKPLYFYENRERYSQFMDKIVHIIVDDFPDTNDPWERENFQRDAIARGLSNQDRNSLLLVTDADEIIDPEVLCRSAARISEGFREEEYYLLRLFYFYANYRKVFGEYSEWPGPFLVRVSSIERSLTQTRWSVMSNGREFNTRSGFLRSSGWHFSYLGNDEGFRYKLQSFAHQEPELQKAADVSIDALIAQRKGPYDHLDRANVWAFVDPLSVRIPAALLEMPSFKRYIMDVVDNQEDVLRRCWDATYALRLDDLATIERLKGKLSATS